MTGLFLSVVDMSITASIVAAAVISARFLLKRAPKVFSYALWVIVLFRLLCPLFLESRLSLLPANINALSPDFIYWESLSVQSNTSASIGTDDPLPENTLSNHNSPITSNDSVSAIIAPNTGPVYGLVQVAACIWLFGIAALLAYSLVSFLQLKRRLASATLVRDHIFQTDRIATPFVLGLIRPRIYIPAGIQERQLDHILEHEQTHIRRKDHLVKPVAFFALVLHWFNPLMWLSFFLMAKDMEMSCDESVLRKSGEGIRNSYSASLLSLSVRRSGLLTPLAFGESSVKSRIRNILNFKKPAIWVVIAAVAAIAVISVCFFGNQAQRINATFQALEYNTNMPDKGYTPRTVSIRGTLHRPLFSEPRFAGKIDVEGYEFTSRLTMFDILLMRPKGMEHLAGAVTYKGINEKSEPVIQNFAYLTMDSRLKDFYFEMFEPAGANAGSTKGLVIAAPASTWEEAEAVTGKYSRRITLEELRRLAAKGDSLVLDEFKKFSGISAGTNSNPYLMVYGVEGGYRLIVSADSGGMLGSVMLESIWEEGGNGIDVRYENLDAFLKSTSDVALRKMSLDDVRALAEKGEAVTAQDLEPFICRRFGSGLDYGEYPVDDAYKLLTVYGLPDGISMEFSKANFHSIGLPQADLEAYLAFVEGKGRDEHRILEGDTVSLPREAVTSPDGRWAIYQDSYPELLDNQNLIYSIYQVVLVEKSTGTVVKVFDIAGAEYDFTWSPDSRYVAVAYTMRTWGHFAVIDTTEMTAADMPYADTVYRKYHDAGEMQYTLHKDRPDGVLQPLEWSPDGTGLLVFYQWYDTEHKAQNGTFIYDIKTQNISGLTQYPPFDGDHAPVRKPDGFTW